MENNEHVKQRFFKRIIITNAKLSEPISRDLIALALSEGHLDEFNKVKAITAYAIMCWTENRNKKESLSMDFLQRTLDSSKPEELKAVIEEFMEYTTFPSDGWLNET